VAGLEWYPCGRLKPATRIPLSYSSTRILIKFDPGVIFRKSDEKIQVSLKYDVNNGYFT